MYSGFTEYSVERYKLARGRAGARAERTAGPAGCMGCSRQYLDGATTHTCRAMHQHNYNSARREREREASNVQFVPTHLFLALVWGTYSSSASESSSERDGVAAAAATAAAADGNAAAAASESAADLFPLLLLIIYRGAYCCVYLLADRPTDCCWAA